MITVAYVNFWKDPNNDRYFSKFIEYNIGPVKEVDCNNNPDILIASCCGNISKIDRIKSKCKIFFYGENLNRYPPYNNDSLLYNTFDLIVGFKYTDLSKKQIRFPLWLIYYKYYNYNEDDNILKYIQNKYDLNVKKDKVLCSVISRHDRGGQRTKIYDEISKYGIVKSPGIYRQNMAPIGNTANDKVNFISSSLFNICPENSEYEGYCTEKIFQAFEGGTIPLYWGMSFPEPEIINRNKYCFCNVHNRDDLKNTIYYAVNNPDSYIEGNIFKEKSHYTIKECYDTLVTQINIKLSRYY
jgi:hypothetical protein